MWACGAAGSALPWHGRGRRFDPDQVHHQINNLQRFSSLEIKLVPLTTPDQGGAWSTDPKYTSSREAFGVMTRALTLNELSRCLPRYIM